MSSKVLIYIFITSLFISCGLKSRPKAPAQNTLPSIESSYQKTIKKDKKNTKKKNEL